MEKGEGVKTIIISQEQPRGKADIKFYGSWTVRDINTLFKELLRAFDKYRKAIVKESRERAKEEEDGRRTE
ncbi:MAG: hypothetical protein DDT18_00725 [Actinobacteria bacterium]|nr:hypothetical protein [Actinomycetota bacterium]